MKSIKEIIDNYKDYETALEDRLGYRLCQFLTEEEAEKIGFKKDLGVSQWPKPKEWTRENILKQLESDVSFGFEKAINQRGISSSLMFEVVMGWNLILEEGLENWPEDNYSQYGLPLFIATAKKYGWNIPEEIKPEDTGKEFKYGINEHYLDPLTLPSLYYINDVLKISTVSSREGIWKGKVVDEWDKPTLPNANIGFYKNEKTEEAVRKFIEFLTKNIEGSWLQEDNRRIINTKLLIIFPKELTKTKKDCEELWNRVLKFSKQYHEETRNNSVSSRS